MKMVQVFLWRRLCYLPTHSHSIDLAGACTVQNTALAADTYPHTAPHRSARYRDFRPVSGTFPGTPHSRTCMRKMIVGSDTKQVATIRTITSIIRGSTVTFLAPWAPATSGGCTAVIGVDLP